MDQKLEKLCEEFISCRDQIRKADKWSNSFLPPICAHLFVSRGKVADISRLQACRNLIKGKTGVFSAFRGTMELSFACMLALEDEPEQALEKTLAAHALLKGEFSSSQYLPLTAFLLKDEPNMEEKVARGKEIYKAMQKNHPFLTSSEDNVFAVMMAFSEKENQQLLTDMENCYTLLKARFKNGNSIQTVSHVLALSEGTPEEKTEKLFALYDELAQSGRKYSKYYELPTLAALAMMPENTRQMAMDMLDADEWLSRQKGYGFWGLPKSTRLMHAAMIVSTAYRSTNTLEAAAMAGTLTMMIAQQIATYSAIAGASSAASH